jgi:hypothetical protein
MIGTHHSKMGASAVVGAQHAASLQARFAFVRAFVSSSAQEIQAKR